MVQKTLEKKKTLFDYYNLLFDGKEEDLDKIPNSSLFVLVKWLSFNKANVDLCQRLNFYFKYVNHDVLKWILYYKIDLDSKYTRYKKSVNDDKFSFVKDYIKSYFSLSEREYGFIRDIVNTLLEKDDFKIMLSKTFGFSESECKKLKIKFLTMKKERKDTGSISLFSFVKK